MTQATLRDTILRIGEDANAAAIAVATYDFMHHTAWSLNPERWFHAASTIKVPVLLAVYDAIEQGRFEPHSRVHVRNRFLSVVDGRPFRVADERDANAEVHAAIGRMLTVHELAEHMIVTSSNLATNLLLDLVGSRPRGLPSRACAWAASTCCAVWRMRWRGRRASTTGSPRPACAPPCA